MAEALAELAAGTGTDARLQRLRGWSASLRGRGACATLDGACNVVSSLLREFPELVEAHREHPCPHCAALRAAPACREAPAPDPPAAPGRLGYPPGA